MNLNCPLYIVPGSEKCWKCKKITKVYGFAAFNDKKFTMLPFIYSIPSGMNKIFKKKAIMYKYSKTYGAEYYMNTCECCGAIQGDFYLHTSPKGCFYNYTESKAEKEGFVIKQKGMVNISCDVQVDNNEKENAATQTLKGEVVFRHLVE